jgi:hypothetical protein
VDLTPEKRSKYTFLVLLIMGCYGFFWTYFFKSVVSTPINLEGAELPPNWRNINQKPSLSDYKLFLALNRQVQRGRSCPRTDNTHTGLPSGVVCLLFIIALRRSKLKRVRINKAKNDWRLYCVVKWKWCQCNECRLAALPHTAQRNVTPTNTDADQSNIMESIRL